MTERVAVIACTADDIDVSRPICVGCYTTFASQNDCDTHVRACPAHRDHFVLRTLHAQAIDDGREDDADDILVEMLP